MWAVIAAICPLTIVISAGERMKSCVVGFNDAAQLSGAGGPWTAADARAASNTGGSLNGRNTQFVLPLQSALRAMFAAVNSTASAQSSAPVRIAGMLRASLSPT